MLPYQISTDAPIEADDTLRGPSDGDSAYNDSIGSASYQTSINSSILNYTYENGRRYHAYKEGEYIIPNDEEEQDRMDLLHHVYGLLLGGELNSAPIKDPQRVLDLGTGTGIWAIDFADQHPSAQVLGNDLSPIQPGWTPPNCMFEIDDYEADWPYSRPFDYIHGRELAGAVKDVSRLFRQAFAHLKAGGFVEMQAFRIEIFCDDDSFAQRAPYTQQWIGLLHEASVKFGKPLANMDEWPRKMSEAGFVDVTCKIVKVPMSPWPKDPKQKEIGMYMQVEQLQAMPAYTHALLSRVLGWSKEEIEVLLAHVAKELKDTSVHQYAQVYFVYGRKP